jgi:hypothetical protein
MAYGSHSTKKHGKKASHHHKRFNKAAHPRNKLGQFVKVKKSKKR